MFLPGKGSVSKLTQIVDFMVVGFSTLVVFSLLLALLDQRLPLAPRDSLVFPATWSSPWAVLNMVSCFFKAISRVSLLTRHNLM